MALKLVVEQSSITTRHPFAIARGSTNGYKRAWVRLVDDDGFPAKGIRVRKSAMQACCRRHEIRPYRPTYRFLRGDPAKQAAAREDLAVLKKKRRRVNSPC